MSDLDAGSDALPRTKRECLKNGEIKPRVTNHAICFPISLFSTAALGRIFLAISQSQTNIVRPSARRREEQPSLTHTSHLTQYTVAENGRVIMQIAPTLPAGSVHVPLSASKWGSSYVIHQRRYLCHTHVNRESARHVRTIIFFLGLNVSNANCNHLCIIIFPLCTCDGSFFQMRSRAVNNMFNILRFLSASADL